MVLRYVLGTLARACALRQVLPSCEGVLIAVALLFDCSQGCPSNILLCPLQQLFPLTQYNRARGFFVLSFPTATELVVTAALTSPAWALTAKMAGIDPTLPIVKNLLLLDSEGKRIAVKYYTPEW